MTTNPPRLHLDTAVLGPYRIERDYYGWWLRPRLGPEGYGPYDSPEEAYSEARRRGITVPPRPAPSPSLLGRICRRLNAWFAEADEPKVDLWKDQGLR
jgi:hypothetical protein